MIQSFRKWTGEFAPYWLWRMLSLGIKDYMRTHQDIRNLTLMLQCPDEILDRKGLYVKRLAGELIQEYQGVY